MNLFIDIGNSRLKWGVWDGEQWTAEGSASADSLSLADWLSGIPAPAGIWLASVSAEERVAAVNTRCEQLFGRIPVRLRTPAAACGVRCAYTEPERLGIDRWLAVVAAYRETGGPAVAIDCGTAITVDAVAQDGEHLGGLIVPGIQLMRRALYGSTAGIRDEGDGAAELLARDTRTAVSGGSLYAAIAFLQRVTGELRQNLGSGTRVLLTGGDAERLRTLLDGEFEWRPRLVLDGMRIMAEEC